MNSYLKNLSKIEFVITHACTGKCRHCSQGNHTANGESINAKIAADAVTKIAAEYDIKTVMTFGGEPLLHADTVCMIMTVACEINIPNRQIITNGYFTKNAAAVHETAKRLADCGVNDLLLSVDAFHQETIPLDTVKAFAVQAKNFGIPVKLQPAWLVSPTHDNAYNAKTREILDSFADIELAENEGNIIFPEGNALRYLAEYFTEIRPENPYIENPYDVRCVSFDANGDVLGDNVYRRDIMDILKNWKAASYK